MTFRRRHLLAIVALVAAVSAWPGAAEKRSVTETDLFDFVWVADPQISPDGARVVFVQVKADRKKDQYDTALWLAVADGAEPPRRLTAGTRDSSPRWSPDGSRLAFVRSVEKDGRAQPPQIHVMDMAGGEPRAVTEIPRGAGSPEWAPDGRTIAFSSTATPEDLEKAKKKDAGADAKGDEAKTADSPRESDVRVITEAVYRANGIPGSGYVDSDRPAHIWTVPVPDGRDGAAGAAADHVGRVPGDEPPVVARRLAVVLRGRSPQGGVLTFRTTATSTRCLATGESRAWWRASTVRSASTRRRPTAGGLRSSGDCTAIPSARTRSPTCSSWTVRAERRVNLTADYDFDIGGGLGGDQRAPRGGHPADPVWTPDGRAILIRVGEQGDANLKRVDAATGKMEPVTTGRHEVMSYTADQAVRRVAMVLSTQTVVGDLHLLDAATGTSKKLTAFNDALFGGLTLSEPEEIWYTSFDGQQDPGLDPEAARLRPREEVPADPRDPRRAALGLRQHLHPRVPVDGGQGLRRALHQPARQHQLRAGVRQRHPVHLSGRRLQGPDGGRGRGAQEGLRRPERGSA